MKTTAVLSMLVLLSLGSCATSGTPAPGTETVVEAAPPRAPEIQSFAAPYETIGSIESLDPGLAALIDPNAPIEVLAHGFKWSEGPIWVKDGGYLLFTDVPTNTMYRYRETDGVSVFMRPSGGPDAVGADAQGANGLLINPEGKLVMCQHGSRRVAVADLASPMNTQTALVDSYEGKRLSSPNDLILSRNGDLYLTDPPYGLAKGVTPDLTFNGVFRRTTDGKMSVVDDTLERPNGIGLSPDGRTLYVANSDRANPIWKAYDVAEDGSTSNGRVFFDATELVAAGREGGNDGLAVDVNGNVFATGPGGVLVLSPEGRHLGTILTQHRTANCKFGADGTTLYLTSHEYLMRVKTRTRGLGF